MATPLDFSGTNPSGTLTALDAYGASSNAISFKEQLPDLASKLREALTTKFNESPLFKQRETAAQQFLAAPSAINADISKMQQGGTILSPTQQQEIGGARRAAAFAPLSTANLMLGNAFGGMENMMQGGVKAFEAASQGMTDRANLMNTMQQQDWERQFKEKQLSLEVQKANKSGGLNFSNLMSMANFMKPTAGKENAAMAASDARTAITRMKQILATDPTAFVASKNPLFRLFSKNAQELNALILRIKDPLIRQRTGAALNNQEITEYDKLVGGLETSGKVIGTNLDALDNIYATIEQRGQPFDLQSFLQNAGVEVPGMSGNPLDSYWGE